MLIYLSMIEDDHMRARFISIYHKYKNLMYHTAYNILQSESDAEDIVHEAFLVVIDYMDRLRPDTVKAFVLAITASRAINLWKRRHHFGEQIPYEEAIHRPAPHGEGVGLDEAIRRLPPEYRTVILLRFQMGYTTREIARMLGKKEGTVTRTITRAKTKLAEELENIQKELDSI